MPRPQRDRRHIVECTDVVTQALSLDRARTVILTGTAHDREDSAWHELHAEILFGARATLDERYGGRRDQARCSIR
jgi:hypothetical protein